MTVALALVAALVAAPAMLLAGPAAPLAAPSSCIATSGGFSWGFKESFRAYVSGSIANGEWSTQGGIGYSTPAFFSDELTGQVRIDGASDEFGGELGVDGALQFTGHEGILDTTISNLRLEVAGSQRLVMVVDITGTTQDFVAVDSIDVPFLVGDLSEGEWSAANGTLTIDQIPLALTEEGAEAFGTYPEGEAFDPLTVTIATTAECATAALAARSAVAQLPLVVAVVAIGGVGVGAAIAVLLVRLRRRTGPTSAAPSTSAAPTES